MILSRITRPVNAAKTVLFVDDEPSLLEARRLVFEAIGYRVLTAESGEEALELLQINTVDAVVLDYLLSGMNGEETARRIRTARGNIIIIILCSGGSSAPQPVVDVFNTSVNKGQGSVALLEALERQIQLCARQETPKVLVSPGSVVWS